MAQNKTLTFNLQQIEFKDTLLTKTVFDISKSNTECFEKDGFYTLDFFHSSLFNDEYYLSIYKFTTESNIPHTFSYYVVKNNGIIPFSLVNEFYVFLPTKNIVWIKIQKFLILMNLMR